MSGAISPQNAEHFRICGNASFHAENYESAAKFYLKALEVAEEGDVYCILCNMSAAYLRLGQTDSALRAAEESIQRSPIMMKGYLRRFRVFERTEQWDFAEETLQICLSTCTTLPLKERSYVETLLAKLPNPNPNPASSLAGFEQQPQNNGKGKTATHVAEINRRSPLPLPFKEFKQANGYARVTADIGSAQPLCIFFKRRVKLVLSKPNKQEEEHFLYFRSDQVCVERCRWEVKGSELTIELAKENPSVSWVQPFLTEQSFKSMLASIKLRLDVTVLQTEKLGVRVDPEALLQLQSFSETVSAVLRCDSTGKEFERKVFEGAEVSLNLPVKRCCCHVAVMADDMEYCVATSERIVVKSRGNKAHVQKVPYLVLKDTNLLCFNIYMPLQSLRDSESEHREVTARLKPRQLARSLHPTSNVPCMRLEGQHKNHLVVYCPAVKSGNAQAVAQEYVDIRLDVPVDIDRGKLQFYGSDFLYLKLPFANMSSSAHARQERDLLRANYVELEVEHYADGVVCKLCQSVLASSITRIEHAPYSPWTALLEHITCVAPEEYKGEGGDPAFGISHVAAAKNVVLMDQAFIQLSASSVDAAAYSLCTELQDCTEPCPEDFVGSSEMAHIQCAECESWLGYLIRHRQGHNTAEKEATDQLRLFKCCVSSRPLDVFEEYKNSSACLVGSLIARRSNIEECQRFVVQTVDSTAEKCFLLLWSQESWMRTEQDSCLHPAMKVLFKFGQLAEGDKSWMLAHPITLRRDYFESLKEDLLRSNSLLPSSCRSFENEMNIGFMRW